MVQAQTNAVKKSKMAKEIYNITAKHALTGTAVDMEFASIKQAKYFNSDMVDFRIIGPVKKQR